MVILITGKANAGKTTLANILKKDIVLDGDEVRKLFQTGFTDGERYQHLINMAKIASLLEAQGKEVVIAAIMPKRKWRDRMRDYFKKSIVLYVAGGHLWPGTEYEEPTADELIIREK